MQEKVTKLISEATKVDPSKITMETNFIDDLNLDSLDIVELMMKMEDEFGIEIPEEDAAEIVIDEDEEVICISKEESPVHKKYRGRGDIVSRLNKEDVVQIISKRKNWRRIVYISDEHLDLTISIANENWLKTRVKLENFKGQISQISNSSPVLGR